MKNSKLLPPDCVLRDTPLCPLLNASNCNDCPVSKCGPEEQAGILEDLTVMAGLLPADGIEPMIKSQHCLLCASEQKEQATCYARLDIGHINPNLGNADTRWYRKLTRSRLAAKHSRVGGMVVPLQVASCSKCRLNFAALRLLPSACSVLLVVAALFLITISGVEDKLASYSRVLPFLAFVALGSIGAFCASFVKSLLVKRVKSETVVDVDEIAPIVELCKMGWFMITDRDSNGYPTFSSRRLKEGLLTGDNQREMLARILGNQPSDEQPSAQAALDELNALIRSRGVEQATEWSTVGDDEAIFDGDEPITDDDETKASGDEPISSGNEPISSGNETIASGDEPIASDDEPISR